MLVNGLATTNKYKQQLLRHHKRVKKNVILKLLKIKMMRKVKKIITIVIKKMQKTQEISTIKTSY